MIDAAEHLERAYRIPATPVHLFGRHVEHDRRSRHYPARRLERGRERRPVLHRRHVPIYDQGAPVTFRGRRFERGTGSCTGNALAGALSTGRNRHRFTQPTALRLYARGTELDSFDGTFLPDDTGSSGLAVCKAALERGWIAEYRHAMTLDEVLDELQERPVIIGIAWKTGSDRPDSTGLCRWTGDVRGGHELCLVGHDPASRRVRFAQSWGEWGDHGFGDFLENELSDALADDGDATIPVAA